MDNLIRFTTVITVGNLLTIAGVFSAAIGVYWALRTKWADAEHAYLLHLKQINSEQTETIHQFTIAQTEKLESCIHAGPDGHAETENKEINPPIE